MSKAFEKLIKEAVKENCDIAQIDNESEGFVIYLISGGSGFSCRFGFKRDFRD